MSKGGVTERFRWITARLNASEYSRGAVSLMVGSTLAQAISVFISPVLTRLYGPAAFGEYGLFMTVAIILAVPITLGYEEAIVLPKDDAIALRLKKLALTIALGGVAVLQLAFLLGADAWIVRLKGRPLGGLAHWVPLGVLLLATLRVAGYWANRRKDYPTMARSRIAQSGAASAANLTLGALGSGAPGLVAAVLMGVAVAIGMTVRRHCSDFRAMLAVPIRELRRTAAEYRALAFKGTPGQLVAVAAAQSLLLLTMGYHGAVAAGHIVLIERVAGVISQIIGRSTGDVLLRKASDESPGVAYISVRRAAAWLLAISLAVHAGLYIGVRYLFVPLFGSEWADALDTALAYLAVSAFGFVFAPLSMLYAYLGLLGWNLVWQLVWLASNVAVFAMGASRGWGFDRTFEVFVVKQCALYAIGVVGILWAARQAARAARLT
jgi:lipopolysaccharide exporter